MKTFSSLSIGVAIILSAGHGVLAQDSTHHAISFQGFLTDNVGNPVTDDLPMTFRIYTSGGNSLRWSETHPSVTVTNGFFNVLLGYTVPFDDVSSARFNGAYDLSVSVDGDPEILPRTPLTSVPYAKNLAGALRVQVVDDNTHLYDSDNIIGGWGFVPADVVGATISGGGGWDIDTDKNFVYGDYGTVGGGWGNSAGGDPDGFPDHGNNDFATVAGGKGNLAMGVYADVAGGFHNRAVGAYSEVPGGSLNEANGSHSFAAGRRAIANHTSAFVWADSLDSTSFESTGVNQFIVRARGGVGLGTNAPTNQLHVAESINGTAFAENHVALIDNTSTGASADVLALRIARTDTIETTSAYITFIHGTNSGIGSISGNGNGGIQINGTGADYAELLPNVDPTEILKPGDVVGVFGGKVSRRTDGADQIMVVSQAPMVVGNYVAPLDGEVLGYSTIAFIGQAGVTVRGPVRTGDFLVASEFGDGTAVAVAPSQMEPDQLNRIVGRAWESKVDPGTGKVNAAVGIGKEAASQVVMTALRQELLALADRVTELEKRGLP